MAVDAQASAEKSRKDEKKLMSASTPDLESTFLDWTDVKEARKTMGLNPWPNSKPDDVENLMATLTSQKSVPSGELEMSQTLKRRQQLIHSSKLRGTASEPDLIRQKPSSHHGSAKYSFGPGYKKPRHLKGKMKIPVMEPRDPDNVPASSDIPGPGTNDIRHYFGEDTGQAGGGISGGWKAYPHSVFVRVFNSFKQQATPEFFDRLAVLLPEIPRLDIVEHVKWHVNYEEHKMKLEHKVWQFREEKLVAQDMAQSGSFGISREMLNVLETSKKERFFETKRVRTKLSELHGQADEERERWGLKEQNPPLDGFKPVQVHAVHSNVISSNVGGLRGHPQFKKSPGYTFSASRELRDLREKQFTESSHVRASSHLDNPGPGAYIGLHEPDRVMKRCASWTFGKDMRFYDPGLPLPNIDAAMRQADLERRLDRVGARKGEITISLMWNTTDNLELRVVPPGGKRGYDEISVATPQVAGGRLDTVNLSSGTNAAGMPEAVRSVSWPRYQLGAPQGSPPKGAYEIYLVVRKKADDMDTPWLCRIMIGTYPRWVGGCVRAGQMEQHIFGFKYDGPVDSSTKLQQDIKQIQLRKPQYEFGREGQRVENCSSEGNVITDIVSTPYGVGPGKYTHTTSFLSQY